MGMYLNPSSNNFRRCLRSKIYIDKTQLISFTNAVLGTEQSFMCVSRPRRFGKTMAADMLSAYYGSGEDTSALFDDLKIAQDPSYKEYLNKYDVIKVDMQYFLNNGVTAKGLIELLTKELIEELKERYPNIDLTNKDRLPKVLSTVMSATGKLFVIIIDEWDCVMRRLHDWSEQKIYLDFLRDLMKNQPYMALAYMTGILPIKKYGEHSTLNMFDEYSMIDSGNICDCFGFTEEEVRGLCEQYGMDFNKMREWYDGYHFITEPDRDYGELSIYSPRSIVSALDRKKISSYWTNTETYEALKIYIQKNYEGLKDDVIRMIAGESVSIDTRSFQNDMTTFNYKDDVLTLLIHLGYLAYDYESNTVSIPNYEVEKEFIDTVKRADNYSEVADAIRSSKELTEALWNFDSDAVAEGIEKAHQSFPSINYNNENALSCVIELAFYYARDYYTIIRELPTGKGYADICLLPKPKVEKPAVIIELKWDRSVDAAIDQIKRKDYPDKLKAYHGNLLLCAVNYDRDSKKHSCTIEKYKK